MKILLICADDYIGRRVLRCLDARKHIISVLSPSSRDPIRYSRFVAEHEAFDFTLDAADTSRRLEALAHYADEKSFDIVIPADVEAAQFLAQAKVLLRHARPYPISDASTLQVLEDKWSFAQLVDRLHIPAPKTALLTDLSHIDRLSIPPPVVIKPVDEGGGHGFHVFNTLDDLIRHVESDAPYSDLPLIVQEFVPGDWTGCNILASQGEVLASTIQKNYSFEEIDFFENKNLLEISKIIVEKTNYTGVAHFDFILDDETTNFKILECNPRFWNSTFASKWLGVDFVELGIDLAFERCPRHNLHFNTGLNKKFLSTGYLIRQTFKQKVSLNTLRDNVPNIWHTFKDPMPLLISKLH